jgi:hypothetical protein
MKKMKLVWVWVFIFPFLFNFSIGFNVTVFLVTEGFTHHSATSYPPTHNLTQSEWGLEKPAIAQVTQVVTHTDTKQAQRCDPFGTDSVFNVLLLLTLAFLFPVTATLFGRPVHFLIIPKRIIMGVQGALVYFLAGALSVPDNKS